MIDIDVRDGEVSVGDTVRATIRWLIDGRAPDAVEVQVGWLTEGRGREDRGTVAEQRIEIDPDDSFATPWTEITATIPDDGPVSYDGNLIRIRWGVHVRLDIPWARDETASEGFRVRVKEA